MRRRGEGRRVTLARTPEGGYSIWMMSRHIQAFCAEWEDVTNFQLPEGIEQQVRICVVPEGEARQGRDQYMGRHQDETAPDAPIERRLERAVAAHEAREGDDTLIRMFRELPQHNQEIIAGQIRANHLEAHGVALQSRAHPHLTGFANVVGELRESVRHTLEVLERLG